MRADAAASHDASWPRMVLVTLKLQFEFQGQSLTMYFTAPGSDLASLSSTGWYQTAAWRQPGHIQSLNFTMTTFAPSAGMPRSIRGWLFHQVAKICWRSCGGGGVLSAAFCAACPSFGKNATTDAALITYSSATRNVSGCANTPRKSVTRRRGSRAMDVDELVPETMKMPSTQT